MINLPHVTVVVPCFNREKTIGEAVLSVLSQDYPDFDVVVVDDGSTDCTLAALAEFEDARLTVIANTEKKGVSGARNTGILHAKGEWIAFQDSDDIWLPGKLKKQMNALDDEDVAVYCAMAIVELDHHQKRVLGRVPQNPRGSCSGYILPGLLWTSLVSTQTMILKSALLKKVGGFDVDLGALVDWELMLRFAQEGTIAFVDEELVEQRFSPNSITRSSLRRLQAQQYIFHKHSNLFEKDPKAFARRAHRISGANRRLGNVEDALSYLRLAISSQPWTLRYRLTYYLVAIGKPLFRYLGRKAMCAELASERT